MNFRLSYKPPKILLCVSIIIVIVAGLFVYQLSYSEKVYARVHIGPFDVSGKTQNEIADLLDKKIDEAENGGFTFHYKNRSVVINPVLSAQEDPDLTYTLVPFNSDAMAHDAFALGHTDSLLTNFKQGVETLLLGKQIPLRYTLRKERFLEVLKANFSDLESPAKDAALEYRNGVLRVTDEVTGTHFLYEQALQKLESQLKNLRFSPIELALSEDKPEISKTDAETLLQAGRSLLALTPIKFQSEKNTWYVGAVTFGDWMRFVKKDGHLAIALDKDKILAYLATIARDADVLPLDAKFKIANNRVTEFQKSENGKKINADETFDRLQKVILEAHTNTVALAIDLVEPFITTANVNNLGIKDLIGTATTDLGNSPKNRRSNIAVGVAKLNGLLITPGDEFSLLQALGEMSEKSGFKEELVIKGDKTKPEFGGGLCQIATTLFRTSLVAGLPITERQNHSYRVPYYEPPIGKDATVYDPAPDFKFKNDTPSYILLQAGVKKNQITFEFWGARDTRVAEQTDSVVTNRVPPPPKKEIETTDLKPGERKCTERAHEGADAKFTYKVTYPDGHIEEKEFRSHYKPWGEVCLIGVDPSSTPRIVQ